MYTFFSKSKSAMDTIIISGIQKGGVGKSTTSANTSFLLVEQGYKVLAVDIYSQANMVQMICKYR